MGIPADVIKREFLECGRGMGQIGRNGAMGHKGFRLSWLEAMGKILATTLILF